MCKDLDPPVRMSLPSDPLCSAAGPSPSLPAADLSPPGPVVQLGPECAAVALGAVCAGVPRSLQGLLVSVFLLLKRSGGLVHPSPSDGCPQPLGLTDAATPPTSSWVMPCSAGPLSVGGLRSVLVNKQLTIFIFSKSYFLLKLLLSSPCPAVRFMFLVI